VREHLIFSFHRSENDWDGQAAVAAATGTDAVWWNPALIARADKRRPRTRSRNRYLPAERQHVVGAGSPWR